jgi:hypothetical protein
MKIGNLIHHRRQAGRDDWGVGLIVDYCEAGSCKARASVRDHWVIHFPNRTRPESSAEFIHTRVSEGLDKDNLKWMVAE